MPLQTLSLSLPSFEPKGKLKTARQRKRLFKKVFFFVAYFFFISGITAVVGIYITFTNSQKPLYVSPLSSVAGIKTDISKDINQVLLEKTLKEKHIAYTSVTMEEDSYIVKQKEGEEIIFSAKKDIFIQISSLQYILSRLTMEGRQFSRLDLRFDKPIITFEE